MSDDQQAAITAAADQLHASLQGNDGEGAAAAMRRLHELNPELASRLLTQLINAGLERMVNGPDPD